MGVEVNRKQLAELIGKSPRWIDKLVEEGMPVKGGGGKGKPKIFDSQIVIDWLIQREVTKRFGGDEDLEPGSSADEDRLLKRARREGIELANDLKRGNVGPVTAFEDIVFNIAGIYASQLDSLGPRVAGDLSAIDDPAEVVHYLDAETRRIRAATAERLMEEISTFTEEADFLLAADDDEGRQSAAEEDAE